MISNNEDKNSTETNLKKIKLGNEEIDIKTALDKCFQLLKNGKFIEARYISKEILKVDVNNTDALIANFLYKFKIRTIEKISNETLFYPNFIDSDIYSQIKQSYETDLSKQLDTMLEEAKAKYDKVSAVKSSKFVNKTRKAYINSFYLSAIISAVFIAIEYDFFLQLLGLEKSSSFQSILPKLFNVWFLVLLTTMIALWIIYFSFIGISYVYKKLKGKN